MALDSRNIVDLYKNDSNRLWQWTDDMIRADLDAKAFPYAVLVENLVSDLNFSGIIRASNAFNAKEIYYIGNKKFDPRGAVGTQHYKNVTHLKDFDELVKLKEKYTLVAVENNIDGAVCMDKFEYTDNMLFVFGAEGVGISSETLSICDKFIYVRTYGSVRSLNVCSCANIILNDYATRFASKGQ